MSTYIMVIKSGWFAYPKLRDESNIIFKTTASSLSEARDYFTKLKDLPTIEFDKMFLVTKLETDEK